MFVPPWYVDILMSSIMVLGSGAFAKCLGHEAESWSVLLKEVPQRSFTPSTMWGHNEKIVIHELGSGPSPDTPSSSTMFLDFPNSELWEINGFIYKLPTLWYAFCFVLFYNTPDILRQECAVLFCLFFFPCLKCQQQKLRTGTLIQVQLWERQKQEAKSKSDELVNLSLELKADDRSTGFSYNLSKNLLRFCYSQLYLTS